MPVALAPDAEAPPLFLRLAAHPIRWRVLGELARSDRAVRELTAMLEEPQSLVSYHLRELRDAGLVTSRRSTADGRDSYYALDLDRCRDLVARTASALHPALGSDDPNASVRHRPLRRRARVLFLCTGNGSRSQIAEALLQARGGGNVDVASAGSHPKPVHPNAVRVLAARGIDIRDRRSKHIDELARRRFDLVVTLCDRVREVCPDRPGATSLHWSIPDPGLESDTDEVTYPAFERTADELSTRIDFLLPLLDEHRRSTRHG
jgi:protein-tyrosine-phosphatase/DNA-binding transcriptional ArsR family regulator